MRGCYVAGVLGVGLLLAGGVRAEGPGDSARAVLADQLVDDARAAGRDVDLPPGLATREALILLKAARSLSPSPEGLRLLTEAARASGDAALALDVARQRVRADGGDLVAQVQFLDLLAGSKQAVDERLAIYQAAMGNAGLNAQVRSRAAVRVAELLLSRGQADDSRAALAQAIALDDTDVEALKERCAQLAADRAPDPDRLAALIALLRANPFQADALQAGAHLLMNAGAYDAAADWTNAAVAQAGGSGGRATMDQAFEEALALTLAGRPVEAQAFLKSIEAAPDKPADLLLLAYTLDAPLGAVPGKADDAHLAELQKRLAAAETADPQNPQVLADRLWVDLFYSPDSPDTGAARLDKLQTLLGENHPTLARLRGWYDLRQNRPAEAAKRLEGLAGSDGYAALGLVRAAEAQKDAAAAKAYAGLLAKRRPDGLLAVHALPVLKRYGLAVPAADPAVVKLAADFPRRLLNARQNPRDLILFTATTTESTYAYGQPIVIRIQALNTTDAALAAGPGGVVTGSVAVLGSLRGSDAHELGLVALDNAPRMFRLEPHQGWETSVRADQGVLRDFLTANAGRPVTLQLTAATEPRVTEQGVIIGPGGQELPLPAVDRKPLSPGDVKKLEAGAGTVDGALLTRVAGAAMLLSPDAPAGNAALQALVKLAQSDDPVAAAWMERLAPVKVPAPLTDALAKQVDNPNALVRMEAYLRASQGAIANGKELLAGRATSEKDPLAAEWAAALAEQMAIPPRPAASAPASDATQP